MSQSCHYFPKVFVLCRQTLNWKLDETYAPADLNLGSYITDPETMKNSFADVGADAQINLARGVVVTNAKIAAHLAFSVAVPHRPLLFYRLIDNKENFLEKCYSMRKVACPRF